MSVPKNIKIGWRNYKIERQDVIDDSEDVYGEIIYDNQIIKVRNNLSDDDIKINLLHECIHGVLWLMGNELRRNEDFVKALSENLYQVFKENGDLLKYFKE